jgi:hypothetical protein
MTIIDARGLQSLMVYTQDAIDAQPAHVADQLRAALHDGRTTLRFRVIDGDLHAVVEVDGYEVASVDVRNLVPLDDL